MLYTHVKTLGLALAILGLASTVVFAQGEGGPAVSTGAVATITTVDAKTGMATLKTEAGEVFELPKGWRLQVNAKVLCDRIGEGPRPRLQNCQPWK